MLRLTTPHVALAVLAVAATSHIALAVYLPGFSPNEYEAGGAVGLKVNKLTSSKTQLPYSYYTLPYCRPEKIQESAENLGETLMGDFIENSPYRITMLKNESCKVLCKKAMPDEDKEKFRSMIEDEYVVNWMVDNLPAATRYMAFAMDGSGENSYTYADGFLVGLEQAGRHYLHNHVLLDFQYHADPVKYEGYRIVGFEVEPSSIVQSTVEDKTQASGLSGLCYASDGSAPPFELDARNEVVFTYDVRWTYSEVRWASRWDSYLKMTRANGQVHWFAILNSLMILLFLSGMVATILLRTLHRDITKYNELATTEEIREETGWKMVHGDVFRRPAHSMLLCVSVGSGMQILGMSVVTLVFALFGVLSPARRGALLQCMMLFFTSMGVFAGYCSTRLCKIFEGDASRWKITTVVTALFYPGIFFSVFFVLNLLIWGQQSSGAVPFATLSTIVVLWFGVSVPLVFVGARWGNHKPAIELPVRVCQIPRHVPDQPWFGRPVVVAFAGGILPFGAVFTELFFIMASIWQHQFYYLFGFLALVLVILVVTCVEVSVALTYIQLTSENHRWWWPSFLSSGSSGVYVFCFSIFYFMSRLQIERSVSIMLYFGYMAILSVMFFLLTGSMGTVSSFYFVRAIYGSIKID
eukprot:CAMPEP_0117489398 /NCGR_PEP_ID=MMETSP0784-20121206/17013_1 /TAXON_ID=39447 /ORGANISM="" /LENGTH=638 /DNA_ID=CAMNT_0005284121 /DNA_START=98 /DNA_END=2014 /DNA_ORIENTATION=+